MPAFTFNVGDHEGRHLWTAPPITADDRDAALATLEADHPQTAVMVVTGEQVTDSAAQKPCGCLRDGLTRARAIWTCICGHGQPAGSASQQCAAPGCGRRKGRNSRGFGCCDADWPEGAPCGTCGAVACAEDIGAIPHLRVDYLSTPTPGSPRDSFTDRRGVLRCAGCGHPE